MDCRSHQNRIEEIATGNVGQTILVTVAEGDRMSDTEVVLAEIQPVGATVDHRHFRAIENRKDSNRHADRAGTDDQDPLPFSTAPRRTAWAPIARNSVMAAWSRLSPSAFSTNCCGTLRYSTMPPSR